MSKYIKTNDNQIINKETGEIIEEQENQFERKLKHRVSQVIKDLVAEGEINPGVTLKVNNLEGENKIIWKPKSHFIKVYNDMFEIIDDYKLDAYELATIIKLMQYVEYETNLICDDEGNSLKKKDLMKLLNYSENKLESILKKLVEKRVLAKTKIGREIIYHMNPNLAFRGKFISPETESIFRGSKNDKSESYE